MQNFVPADHYFVMLGQNLLQFLVVVGLKILIRLHPVRGFESLYLGIAVPEFPIHLITTDVEIGVGKKPPISSTNLSRNL